MSNFYTCNRSFPHYDRLNLPPKWDQVSSFKMADGSSKPAWLWPGFNTVYRIQLTIEISGCKSSAPRTQWFIGQYCSERERRGYRCRCTSFPFYDALLWLHSTDARKGDGFFLFQAITDAQVRFFFFYFYNTFPHFFSTFTTWPSISSLFQRPIGHESRRFSCQCRIIVHYDTSAMKRFLTSLAFGSRCKLTLVKKTFFAWVSYEILNHEVWKCGFPHAKRA